MKVRSNFGDLRIKNDRKIARESGQNYIFFFNVFFLQEMKV